MWKKRALDMFLTVVGSVVWLPVVAAVGLAVLIAEGRPVFYRSRRRVDTERVVVLTKFRTMVRNADQVVNRDTVPVSDATRFLNIPADSPLYTRVGRFIERYALTELPQLWHVVRGEMSVVGNRPLPQNVIDCLREEFPQVSDRFLTRAGLTGPAQLVGREALSDAQRLELESAYCRACLDGYQARLDVVILLATIFGVLGIGRSRGHRDVLELIARYSGGGARTLPVLAETQPS
jgi:lipopolysaccharide/colanic/teichoic acid biosynthesis glycosyltransferase